MRFFLLSTLALGQLISPVQSGHQKLPPVQDDRFVRDLHDKNVADILDVYTPRAVVIDPAGKSFKGTSDLREHYEQITSQYDSDLHLTTTRFEPAHSVVIEHGVYTENRRYHDTGAQQDIHGTYVFLHERQSDGAWLIAHQKWTETPIH